MKKIFSNERSSVKSLAKVFIPSNLNNDSSQADGSSLKKSGSDLEKYSKEKSQQYILENYGSLAIGLAPRIKFIGDLVFSDSVIIQGNFRGDLKVNGTLLITEKALVEGKIFASKLVVFGEVKGDIYITDSVELKPGSSLEGNLFCENLVLNSGARLNADCSISCDKAKRLARLGFEDSIDFSVFNSEALSELTESSPILSTSKGELLPFGEANLLRPKAKKGSISKKKAFDSTKEGEELNYQYSLLC